MAERKRFLLRLDPRLFEALHRWADEDLRSINAQIEYLLADQARRAGRLPQRRGRVAAPEADAATPPGDAARAPARRRGAAAAGAGSAAR